MMQQSLEQAADLKGSISALGTNSRPAFLLVDRNRLYLRALLQRYAFTPEQIVAIEEERDKAISIKHTRLDYPAEIVFSSSVSAAEIISIIRTKGFVPSASIGDMPIRQGLPVRLEIVIPICLIVIWSMITSSSFGLNQLVHSQKLGDWRPIPIGVMFFIGAMIRFIPPVQWLVLRPGRQIGEISPFLNLLILVSGLLGIVSTLIILHLPEPLAILAPIFVIWLIGQIDRRLADW